MQTMQDKDFDQLFKNSFENFEVEPGANTWNQIEQRMGRKPKVRVLNYRWMAAASVAIIAAAALLINTDTEPMKLTGKSKVKPAETIDKSNAAIQDISPVETITGAGDEQQVASVPSLSRKGEVSTEKQEVISEPVKQEQGTTLIAQAPQPQAQQDKQPVINNPGAESGIASAAVAEEKPAEQTSLAKIAQEKQDEGKRRSFSVGRLVNSIVAKVDNREDKVIEFRDEDDTSILSGINLGFLRIKKNK